MTGPDVQRRPRWGGVQDRLGSTIKPSVAPQNGLLRAISVAVRGAVGGPGSEAGAQLAGVFLGRDRTPIGEVLVPGDAETDLVVHVSARRRALTGGGR